MAEIFLKLGCGLVGWLLVFAHGLVVAVIPSADCSEELGRVSLGFALLAGVAAAFLLPAALPWRGFLRWASLPALALWLPAAWLAAGLVGPLSFAAVPLCDALAGAGAPAGEAAAWQRAWPPIQLVAIAACAFRALAYWRPEAADARPA